MNKDKDEGDEEQNCWEYFDEFNFFKYSVDVKGDKIGHVCESAPRISRIQFDLEEAINFGSFEMFKVKSRCKERCKFKCNPKRGLHEFIAKNLMQQHSVISNISSSHDFEIELPDLKCYNVQQSCNGDILLQKYKAFQPIMQLNLYDCSFLNPSFDNFQTFDFPISLRSVIPLKENDFHFDYNCVDYKFGIEEVEHEAKGIKHLNPPAIGDSEYNLDEFIQISRNHDFNPNNYSKKTENLCKIIESTSNSNIPNQTIDLTRKSNNSMQKSRQSITFAIATQTISKELFTFHLIEIPSNMTILYGRKCSFLILNNVTLFSIDQILTIYSEYCYWKSKKSLIIIYDFDYQLDELYYELLLKYKIMILVARNSSCLIKFLRAHSELDKFCYLNEELSFEKSLNILPFLNPITTKYLIKKYSLEENPLKAIEMSSILLADNDLFGEHQLCLISQ